MGLMNALIWVPTIWTVKRLIAEDLLYFERGYGYTGDLVMRCGVLSMGGRMGLSGVAVK